MREETLGRVLLVKAVEETDRSGELLPLADREQATRTVLRAAGDGGPARPSAAAVTATGEARGPRLMRLLAERAELLFGPLTARYPVFNDILERSRLPAWFTALVVGGAVAAGVALASLDGTRRINILAFPFIGVIAWSLAVYAIVIAQWARGFAGVASGERAASGSRVASRWVPKAIARRLSRLVDRTSKVHAKLGEVVARYAADWAMVGGRLLSARVRGLLHLAAAALALGMIAGLYLRGVVLRYEAGWESTFLGPAGVRSILGWFFCPASAITGIPLPPTDAAVAALRWTPEGGGGNAAPWIHLIAATLGLYVIVPRLVLAGCAYLDAWRWRRASALPDTLLRHARSALGAAQAGHGSGTVIVAPYACDVSAQGREGLQRWLESQFGKGAHMDLRATVAYGQEEELRTALGAGAPVSAEGVVLLMSLAATPESENHGLAIAAARDIARATRPEREVRVVVDESAYLARFAGDASLAGRIEARRELWRRFVRGHGLDAVLIDLATVP